MTTIEPVETGRVSPPADTICVPSPRLDDLTAPVGAIVIAQAQLKRIAGRLSDPELEEAADEIDRLVVELRDAAASIRMLPIQPVFDKIHGLVSDLSEGLNKPAHLFVEGGDVEVDKDVLDSLAEPLAHLIRNAIEHGIEAPEDRAKADKAAAAHITLRACQAGGEVLVSVSDDGRGLDANAIRTRAIEGKLIAADDDLSDEAPRQVVFARGFSTVEPLPEVSGRGSGLDVVRRVAEELRGSVELSSQKGAGTDVTLRLPLTRAIVDGLLVRVADGSFILPLSAVEESVELPHADSVRESGRSILHSRDELVPFLRLDTLFGSEPMTADDRRVVIISVDGRRIGLVVDEVIGQHQTVIKPLTLYHRGIEGLAGSTILGDGSVALILDPAAIIKRAQGAQRVAA
ncbi:chemotaxis protein CheA [Palleronia sp.]|uniref:chemotaxis protein CheA n=1 Tax=Palleronia sp. TaxID=1940284 RepID=UPI0035C840E2